MICNYEINEDTYAIISEGDYSRVIENNSEYIIQSKSIDIMEHSCRYFGSSYLGRETGTKYITGMNNKVPICVNDDIIFFPTSSPRNLDCCFLAFDKIKAIEKVSCSETRVIFFNDKAILLPFSYRSLNNQIIRSFRLSYLIKSHCQNT